MYSAASAGMTWSTEPAAAPTARVRRMSRRLILSLAMCVPHVKSRAKALPLQIPFLGFVEKIFGSGPGERHDRQRGIFGRVGHQRRAIGDEKILHVMGLAETVEDGRFRVGAHARGADFVDNLAASLNAERILSVDGSLGAVFAAHGFDDGAESLLHVLGLEQFVIRPLEVEAQGGNAPLIDNIGIDLPLGVPVRKHFASPGEADVRAVRLPGALLQLEAVSLFIGATTVELADSGHLAPAAEFDVIAAGESVLP